jgi:hypothetical protein
MEHDLKPVKALSSNRDETNQVTNHGVPSGSLSYPKWCGLTGVKPSPLKELKHNEA